MQPLFLHPRDLDALAPHLFWHTPPDDALIASLDRLGQTTPALVIATDARPILAAGSRRTVALRELRGRTLAAVSVDAASMPENEPDLPLAARLGLLYLASNMGRTVTEPMLVAAGRYFMAHGSRDEFLSLAGPYLFAPGDRRERLVCRWLDLPPCCDDLVASGHVPLGAAELLAGCEADTRAALLPLLTAIRWSRANLDNALTWLDEAARLAGERPAALLARSGALELAERGLSPNDLAAGVLAALRRLRYPATTTLEARFAALSRKLLSGSRVKLRPSQGFESDAVTVELTVRRPTELSKAAGELAAMAASPDLPRLLAVAHEEDPA
ncbi:MAG: chromosome partitioning protein ParB [Solidesulfovibrio sp.]